MLRERFRRISYERFKNHEERSNEVLVEAGDPANQLVEALIRSDR
jgi:hypothetical protein